VVEYVDRKEGALIQAVRTHQHTIDSAVVQTAGRHRTEVQRETRKIKSSIAQKRKKKKMAREEEARTIAT
jgi:hypothetical protein